MVCRVCDEYRPEEKDYFGRNWKLDLHIMLILLRMWFYALLMRVKYGGVRGLAKSNISVLENFQPLRSAPLEPSDSQEVPVSNLTVLPPKESL